MPSLASLSQARPSPARVHLSSACRSGRGEGLFNLISVPSFRGLCDLSGHSLPADSQRHQPKIPAQLLTHPFGPDLPRKGNCAQARAARSTPGCVVVVDAHYLQETRHWLLPTRLRYDPWRLSRGLCPRPCGQAQARVPLSHNATLCIICRGISTEPYKHCVKAQFNTHLL